MKDKIIKYILTAAVFLCALAFVAKFAKPSILKLYIQTGFGDCKKLPILCIAPDKEIINPEVNKAYLAGLLPYSFADMEILAPKSLTVIKEKVRKAYYKKHKRRDKGALMYLLYEEPNFFADLFPRVKKQGIFDNYAFLSRAMHARISGVNNLTDAFFVIVKTIFIPDLGNQDNIKMVKFYLGDKKGFINYNLGTSENYFDCNIIDKDGNFFKVYIKDKGATLSLDKVLAIVSSVKSR